MLFYSIPLHSQLSDYGFNDDTEYLPVPNDLFVDKFN